jgi:hypothetical protein
MPTSAQAFDDVDWNWNKEVQNLEQITINVNDTFDLSGLTEIEKLQVNAGNVTANATLSDFENNAPGGMDSDGTATFELDDVLTIFADWDQTTGDINASDEPGAVTSASGDIDGEVLDGPPGHVTELTNGIENMQVAISGTFEVPIEDVSFDGIRDAVDLPKVVNTATAVANNQSIDSTVAVNLHDAQFNFGGFDSEGVDSDARALALADQTGNFHTDAAVALTIAGALGIITQGEVSANAVVDGTYPDDVSVLNAYVDNTATAVGNNMSVDVAANLPGDALMIADLTQFNYANTTANAVVDDVQINDYAGLGAAGFGGAGEDIVPLVNNVATAVGNNVSISVSNVPEVDVP